MAEDKVEFVGQDELNLNHDKDVSHDSNMPQATDVEEEKRRNGLTTLTAAIFLVGEMAGIGVLALPRAVENASWIGLVLVIVFGLAAMYTARLLGHCWNILQARYPEFRGKHIRYPYPAIAEKAVGKWMRYIVSFSIDFTLFGAIIVFMLLASQNIASLLIHTSAAKISFCYWTIIVAVFMIPLTWLGTPKDFWPLAVGAMVATVIACVMVFGQSLAEIGKETVTHKPVQFLSFVTSFGAISFAFGGHSTFPTIQHDMRDPSLFPSSCVYAFSTVIIMYLPVAAVGYFVYGADVKSNILLNLPEGIVAYFVKTLITVHLLLAFVIVMNPLSQEFEELLKIPHKFSWKRCLLRTIIVLVALFVAESIPHFGAILDLVGGSSVTLLVFVAPPLFYIRLCQARGDWDDRNIHLHELVLNYEIMIVGILSGVASVAGAVHEITSPGTFVLPCYVNATAAKG